MHGTVATGSKDALMEREQRGGTLVLMLARPDARNSLSEALIEALQDAIDHAAADATIRAVTIGAQGSVFSSGHDLKELTAHRADADGGRAFTKLLMHKCSKLMRSISLATRRTTRSASGLPGWCSPGEPGRRF